MNGDIALPTASRAPVPAVTTRCRVDDAGVGARRVQLREQPCNIVRRGDITGMCDDLLLRTLFGAADFEARRLQDRGSPSGDVYMGAAAGEFDGNRETDAARSAGDQRVGAREGHASHELITRAAA